MEWNLMKKREKKGTGQNTGNGNVFKREKKGTCENTVSLIGDTFTGIFWKMNCIVYS